jgi:hypothetical protein
VEPALRVPEMMNCSLTAGVEGLTVVVRMGDWRVPMDY